MPAPHRFAIDIETISTVDDPDFSDPEHWIPFCVAAGHLAPGDDEPEVEVLFRSDSSIAAERRLLDRTIDWIAERSESSEPLELVTYNGESYDIPILQHRAAEISGSNPGVGVRNRLDLLLYSAEHVDLMQHVVDRRGYHASLDDVLDDHGIECDKPEWLGDKVTGGDMPEFGLELLSDRPDDELRDAVRRYAASDVQPLFDLHRQLRSHKVPE